MRFIILVYNFENEPVLTFKLEINTLSNDYIKKRVRNYVLDKTKYVYGFIELYQPDNVGGLLLYDRFYL